MFSVKKTSSDYNIGIMNIAYDALITYGADCLPINPLSYLKKQDNVSIYNYDEFPRLIDITTETLISEFGKGILIYSEEDDKYCIIYNPNLEESDLRLFLSYCIAAARLQMDEFMVESGSGYTNFENSNIINDFTHFFIAPDPILKECKIYKTEEILKYCQIPFKFAHDKHKRLRSARKHSIRYATEDLLIKNFSKFIRSFRS